MASYLDKTASLIPEAYRVLVEHDTEPPHSGSYNQLQTTGTYLCRRCGRALFHADSQFSSGCGWPSFDVEIPMHVRELSDPDGQRIEIRCQRCDGHLGHVFSGEYFTAANKRYCVNAVALDFVDANTVEDTGEAIVAGGCFWGIDYYLRQIPGVIYVEVGYTGGHAAYPTYEQVCSHHTGHFEAVRIIYDIKRCDYGTVIQRFFEIHDPTQANGQGVDIGPQYQSAIFYYNDEQYALSQALVQQLQQDGYLIATQFFPVTPFWPAESYHQDYYGKQGRVPACHRPVTHWHKK